MIPPVRAAAPAVHHHTATFSCITSFYPRNKFECHKSMSRIICYNCNDSGHRQDTCTKPKKGSQDRQFKKPRKTPSTTHPQKQSNPNEYHPRLLVIWRRVSPPHLLNLRHQHSIHLNPPKSTKTIKDKPQIASSATAPTFSGMHLPSDDDDDD
ncbi:CCHC-type zinc finger transcription factor [Mucor lusitanicus CBS 277.49]|uniref:CCHC-type zinc finger transcription factor n=1 Tax=Mucor lusitanicus CBS 277.49 TaxID=747725 RepID=A0A168J8B6_MUCCL|nr:CCHC-type zinc finger transcription factor [Mucor lusitanicus CBS 277.49]